MLSITPSQCRAARALLNWTQPELAERCGVHVQTISNFEKDASTPSKSTLDKISTVLQLQGIALLEDDGVKRNTHQIQSFFGQKGFIDFKDDVYETTRNGGDVYVANVDEHSFLRWDGDAFPSMKKRMCDIQDLNFLILIKEGDDYTPASDYATYRWTPAANFESISYYIYGDKTAFISFQEDTVDVFVIKHRYITNYFKKAFKVLWKNSIPIKKSP